MSIFDLYLKLGIDHISDIKAYDHILFIVALTVSYSIRNWKKLLILVTAFTLGHSITLILATLDLIRINTGWIEFLIPVTILLTALLNIIRSDEAFTKGSHKIKYGAALFFGLIHGMGFSNYLRSLLTQEDKLWLPLLSFNIGIELGQLIIVLIMTGLSLLLVDLFGVKCKSWILVLSGAALGISLIMALERLPW